MLSGLLDFRRSRDFQLVLLFVWQLGEVVDHGVGLRELRLSKLLQLIQVLCLLHDAGLGLGLGLGLGGLPTTGCVQINSKHPRRLLFLLLTGDCLILVTALQLAPPNELLSQAK